MYYYYYYYYYYYCYYYYKPKMLRKLMTKRLCRNFDESFPVQEKNGLKKDLPVLPPREFFHVYIINNSNHTVSLAQFGINLRSSLCNVSFLKNSVA